MIATEWPKIPATTLADRVYHVVRARILEARVAPGEFIREKELNEAMGVSRTPVREALGRLASEGFLERIPHRGFRVSMEPVADLLELYAIVASLELLAGKLALRKFSHADLARLMEINRRIEEPQNQRDARRLIELNNEFHRVFSERSGNQRLADLLEDLRAKLSRLELWYYSSPEHIQQSTREHDEIIRSIEQGDHDQALAILERNMALTYTSLLEEHGKNDGSAPPKDEFADQ